MSAVTTTPASYLLDDMETSMESGTQDPFDLSKGQPILGMRVDDHQVMATMSVGQLLGAFRTSPAGRRRTPSGSPTTRPSRTTRRSAGRSSG